MNIEPQHIDELKILTNTIAREWIDSLERYELQSPKQCHRIVSRLHDILQEWEHFRQREIDDLRRQVVDFNRTQVTTILHKTTTPQNG